MNMHHTEWTAGLVALFHRFDVQAFAWDVQEVRHLRGDARASASTRVYCDHVDRMVATVAEWTTSTASCDALEEARGRRAARSARRRGRRSMSSSIGPKTRESFDASRLSPITKRCPWARRTRLAVGRGTAPRRRRR